MAERTHPPANSLHGCVCIIANVSLVFLRQMEYNAGVLILTTNRVGEFDEAFVSRIHMKLHFPKLTEDSTMDVWRMNIRRLKEKGAVELKEERIMAFARSFWKANKNTPDRQWNGRQIKNVSTDL